MGYFLYGHGGSGDHDAEDRIRGTCRLLPCPPEVVTEDPQAQWRYGIGHLAALTRLYCAGMGPGDTCLAARPGSGELLKKTGAKALLWCWSTGEKLPRHLEKDMDALVVTDCRSLEILQSAGLGRLAHLGPDPAFLVQRQLRPLNGAFRRDTVGLCFSAAVRRYEERDSLLYESYCRLIRFLLSETAFDIALIPYCVKPRQNDALLHTVLHRQFEDTGRVHLRPDGSSQELRGDLSMCRFVLGSTGAIAAWSCGVPALCLGADPRAMGLAAELFGDWRLAVQPVAWLKEETDLLRAFRIFLSREDKLRRQLETAVPYRRQRSLSWSWNTMTLQA